MKRSSVVRQWVGAGIVAVLVAAATSAAAEPSGGGELGPDRVRARARDQGSGTFPGHGLPVEPPPPGSPVLWTRTIDGGLCVVFAGGVPAELAGRVGPLPGGPHHEGDEPTSPLTLGAPANAVLVDAVREMLPPDAAVYGELMIDVGTPRVPEDQADPRAMIIPICVGSPAEDPPEPPSAAEVWQETPLPLPVIHVSPPGTSQWPGVTGLGAHFWADTPPNAVATAAIRGFEVTVTAQPVAYAWSLGDGRTLVGTLGAADAPIVARWVRKGTYDLTLHVVWHATSHATYPSLGLVIDEDLGNVTIPTTIPYRVAEVRSLLRPIIRERGGSRA